jgi:hypothetical protein
MPGTLTALLIGAAVQATGNAKRVKAYFDIEPHLLRPNSFFRRPAGQRGLARL